MTGTGKLLIAILITAVVAVAAVLFVNNYGTGITERFFGSKLESKDKQKDGTQAKAVQPDTKEIKQDISNDSAVKQKEEDKAKEEEKKKPKDIKVKAVYLSGSTAGNKTSLNNIINLVKSTELNAVVIDVKDDFGKVNFASNIPEIKSNGSFHVLYDVDSVIKVLHENNIYVIARIVTFKDPWLANKRADLAIKKPNGQLWKENNITPWTNPYNEEVWKYNINIAKEAIDKGFDEIQFDYVRFPSARKTDVDFGATPPPKSDAVNNFLKTANKELFEGKGIKVSADVFGIICESAGDLENIGQDLEKVGKDIEYISPMIYPSHFANAGRGMMGNGVGQGINGIVFTAPDLKPYEVVYNTLIKSKNRIAKVQGYNAKIRPYLQAFTASYIKNKAYYQTYGPEQVKLQIKAVYDAGYEEWILWDANNKYPEGYFEKKKAE